MTRYLSEKVSFVARILVKLAAIFLAVLVVLSLVAVIKQKRPSLNERLLQAAGERCAGSEKRVRGLLDQGADPNAKDPAGRTPLHLAILSGQPRIAELLVNKGADINAKNMSGTTPLMYAVRGGPLEGARLLIARGADVNARDNRRRTAMMYVGCREPEIVRLLIDHGADVNARDLYGKTVLRFVHPKNRELADFLKAAGAKE